MIIRHRGPIALPPTPAFTDPAGAAAQSSRTEPSFLIRPAIGAALPPTAGFSFVTGSGLRLDRINSRHLLACARQIYFRYLSNCGATSEPVGVVMVGESIQGRVVFDLPVLLPEEQFVPIDLVRTRPGPRTRNGRPATARSIP